MASSITDEKYKAVEPKVLGESADKKGGTVDIEIQFKIINLVKPHLSMEQLETLLLLLMELDTAARRDIVNYGRKNGLIRD